MMSNQPLVAVLMYRLLLQRGGGSAQDHLLAQAVLVAPPSAAYTRLSKTGENEETAIVKLKQHAIKATYCKCVGSGES